MCLFSDVDAFKVEHNSKGVSSDTRVLTTDGSSREIGSQDQPKMLKSLGVSDNKKSTKAQAIEINKLLAKLFHHNALPFNVVESDEFKDCIKALCLAYYQQGIPGLFWMETTVVEFAYEEVHSQVEEHLQGCDAIMANMGGWENEKKQQLKIVILTGKNWDTILTIMF